MVYMYKMPPKYPTLDVYFHMKNHYNKLKSVTGTLNTFSAKGVRRNSSSRPSRPLSRVSLDKHQRQSSNVLRVLGCGVKKHSCLNKEELASSERSQSLPPRPPTRRKASDMPEPYKSASRAHSASPSPKRCNTCQKSKENVNGRVDLDLHYNTPRSTPGKSEEPAPETSHGLISCQSQTEPILEAYKCPALRGKPSVPDHEYLQFSLRITEDIIRNELYRNKEMKRVFNSHIEANRGRLDMQKMLQQIEILSNELNLPFECSDDKEDVNPLEIKIARQNIKKSLVCICSSTTLDSSECEDKSPDDSDLAPENIADDKLQYVSDLAQKVLHCIDNLEEVLAQPDVNTRRVFSLECVTEETEPKTSEESIGSSVHKTISSVSDFEQPEVLPGFEDLEKKEEPVPEDNRGTQLEEKSGGLQDEPKLPSQNTNNCPPVQPNVITDCDKPVRNSVPHCDLTTCKYKNKLATYNTSPKKEQEVIQEQPLQQLPPEEKLVQQPPIQQPAAEIPPIQAQPYQEHLTRPQSILKHEDFLFNTTPSRILPPELVPLIPVTNLTQIPNEDITVLLDGTNTEQTYIKIAGPIYIPKMKLAIPLPLSPKSTNTSHKEENAAHFVNNLPDNNHLNADNQSEVSPITYSYSKIQLLANKTMHYPSFVDENQEAPPEVDQYHSIWQDPDMYRTSPKVLRRRQLLDNDVRSGGEEKEMVTLVLDPDNRNTLLLDKNDYDLTPQRDEESSNSSKGHYLLSDAYTNVKPQNCSCRCGRVLGSRPLLPCCYTPAVGTTSPQFPQSLYNLSCGSDSGHCALPKSIAQFYPSISVQTDPYPISNDTIQVIVEGVKERVDSEVSTRTNLNNYMLGQRLAKNEEQVAPVESNSNETNCPQANEKTEPIEDSLPVKDNSQTTLEVKEPFSSKKQVSIEKTPEDTDSTPKVNPPEDETIVLKDEPEEMMDKEARVLQKVLATDSHQRRSVSIRNLVEHISASAKDMKKHAEKSALKIHQPSSVSVFDMAVLDARPNAGPSESLQMEMKTVQNYMQEFRAVEPVEAKIPIELEEVSEVINPTLSSISSAMDINYEKSDTTPNTSCCGLKNMKIMKKSQQKDYFSTSNRGKITQYNTRLYQPKENDKKTIKTDHSRLNDFYGETGNESATNILKMENDNLPEDALKYTQISIAQPSASSHKKVSLSSVESLPISGRSSEDVMSGQFFRKKSKQDVFRQLRIKDQMD